MDIWSFDGGGERTEWVGGGERTEGVKKNPF